MWYSCQTCGAAVLSNGFVNLKFLRLDFCTSSVNKVQLQLLVYLHASYTDFKIYEVISD